MSKERLRKWQPSNAKLAEEIREAKSKVKVSQQMFADGIGAKEPKHILDNLKILLSIACTQLESLQDEKTRMQEEKARLQEEKDRLQERKMEDMITEESSIKLRLAQIKAGMMGN